MTAVRGKSGRKEGEKRERRGERTGAYRGELYCTDPLQPTEWQSWAQDNLFGTTRFDIKRTFLEVQPGGYKRTWSNPRARTCGDVRMLILKNNIRLYEFRCLPLLFAFVTNTHIIICLFHPMIHCLK